MPRLPSAGIKNTDAEMRDAVVNDATKFAGGNIDETISAAKTLTAAERTSIQSKILSDATAFAGGDIALVKTETDKQPNVVHWLPAIWGGFEDELLLKAAANPAALDVATRLTPTLPTGATVWKSYLLFKFRELYCATANFVATAGVVQVQKVAGGAWVSGITIPTGTLDVGAGLSAAGDVLIGNVDVAAQVASGSQVEFQLITLRSNVDDLAIRDIQPGLLIGYTV